MTSRVIGVVAGLAFLATGVGADAAYISQQGGQFHVRLPAGFRAKQQGDRMIAQSAAGNIKVFARGKAFTGRTYDFAGHFSRWEKVMRERGIYKSLRRLGDRRQVRKDGQISVFRIYEATAIRKTKTHPYRVLTMAAFVPGARRAYTLAIAAEASVFAQRRGELLAIAASFVPKVANQKMRPKSLAGKLRRVGGRLVAVPRKGVKGTKGAKAPRARVLANVKASPRGGAIAKPVRLVPRKPAKAAVPPKRKDFKKVHPVRKPPHKTAPAGRPLRVEKKALPKALAKRGPAKAQPAKRAPQPPKNVAPRKAPAKKVVVRKAPAKKLARSKVAGKEVSWLSR
jgi:hypothetical protein